MFKKIVISIAIFCMGNSVTFATSLWENSRQESFFADHTARKVGDVVYIIISESSQATNKSATKKSKDAMMSGGPTAVEKGEKNLLDFIPFFGAKGKSTYDGKGDTSRSGRLSAKISASVLKILPNGNLYIEGKRTICVNSDEQEITVSGIVRPEDIDADNTIYSSCIADASIKYKGETVFSDKERPGIITRAWTKLLGILF